MAAVAGPLYNGVVVGVGFPAVAGGKVMNANFDPYREALVVETDTVWPDQCALSEAERAGIEARLHADPQNASQLEYVRLPTGFCRQITVTAEDLERMR